ncbi:MAG: sugar kinase [Rickettsiella sp.]|nr:sugar kinase [Rickettsiella sp.]
MKQIAVIGEAMLELSQQSDTVLDLSFAGDTLNFATYLRRLLPKDSFDVRYVTALGFDPYSEIMLKKWQQEGINTDLVFQVENKIPGLYLIRTDKSGERTFYFYRQNSAARELFKIEAANNLEKHMLEMDYLYLSGITLAIFDADTRENLWKLLEKTKQKGSKIIFDTNYRASLWPDAESAKKAIERTLKYVDIAFPTFVDEQILFGDRTPEVCAKRLLENGITEVIVKCGSEPALIATIDQIKSIPAYAVKKVIDTTGAGDSFNAAYLAARLLGFDPIKAIQWGHQLASAVIAHSGAIISLTDMPHLT